MQPKLQMIKFLLRLHLAWLQPTAYIVNDIAICEIVTVWEWGISTLAIYITSLVMSVLPDCMHTSECSC